MAKKRAASTSGEPVSREGVHVFGVRHLSPMASFHLRRLLDEVQPTAVLIEGLSDAESLIRDITRKKTVPPIAILAYSDSLPVRTLVYPIARYSPEYQALLWADENSVDASFIDLPSDIFLALQDDQMKKMEQRLEEIEAAASGEQESEAEESDEDDSDDESETAVENTPPPVSIYDRMAGVAGERDYDTYWERRFEHNTAEHAYRLAAFELGKNLRELESDTRSDFAENLVREAYMRRRIDEAIRAGHSPEKIVAVVGAFHAPVLGDSYPSMTDEELESLPTLKSKRTLMPYSYFKLSSQSGYGAGNHAPAYFELLWDCLCDSEQDDESVGTAPLATRYLAGVVRELRKSGTHRSTAEVIESVRLARTLSALQQGSAPVLEDLRDAAVAIIGQGDVGVMADPFARVEVGTAIGELPKGVSQTSIQDDFNQQLKDLKLEKYRTPVKQDLTLDLRENRRAKTETAAFADLHRSTFLHRLQLLSVPFASQVATQQDSATWAEAWQLAWTPEAEIALVEAVLMGETVEQAAAFRFQQKLNDAKTIGEAAGLVGTASECGMVKGMIAARGRLQQLAASGAAFSDTASAAYRLMTTARYGDVRRFDPEPLLPLMDELFVQGALAMVASANCDAKTATSFSAGMDQMNKIALEHDQRVDETLWVEELQDLAARDDRNPLLSGYAAAILLERGVMDNEELSREVSRRLSPGVPADLGAGWFEGLAGRNRYALLARQSMWTQLADYIAELDDEQFRRSLVFLRRAFGSFSAPEKRAIAENLGEVWGTGGDLASELIEQPMSEEEEQAIEDLNEFDFDDF